MNAPINPSWKRYLLTGALVIVIVTISVLSVRQRVRMTNIGYEIQAMKAQKQKLMKIHKQLLIEAESVSAMDRIEETAIRQLAMVPALPTTRVYVNDR
jgi:cell division protein FtsL